MNFTCEFYKKQLLFFLFFLVNFSVQGQVANYTFSQTNGTWTPVTAGGTHYNVFLGDDVGAFVTLPFTFVYNGTNYTDVSVRSNGIMRMGTAASATGAGNEYVSASNTNGQIISTSNAGAVNILSPLSFDLINNSTYTISGTRTSGSNVLTALSGANFTALKVRPGMQITGTGIPANTYVVSVNIAGTSLVMSANATSTGAATTFSTGAGFVVQTVGSAPNRIYKMQYTGYKRFGLTEDLDFMVELYETTNEIKFSYNFVTVATVGTAGTGDRAQVGIKGASNADFNNRATTTDWSATTAGGANTAYCLLSNTVKPLSGLTYTWTPPLPTISSVSTSAVCAGGSITINGTNLLVPSAANVLVGGTPVTAITSNTSTQIVATVAAGTTGFVTVTNTGGTVVSAGSLTVNALPATPAIPTSNSPQCTPPGVTISQTGTPPVGETWYWQTSSTGTSTTDSGTTYTATTSGTYYIRAQNTATGCWSAASASITITITPQISTLATTPVPSNAQTNVCYSGSGATTALSWTAAASATSYDVYFGAGSLPGTVTANVAATTYAVGTLLAATTYYWKIVPKTACGATTGAPITWSFTTAAYPCYCNPTYGTGPNTNDAITNVSLGNLSNTTVGNTVSPYFTFYNAVTIPTLQQSSTNTISISYGVDSNQWCGVWIDFNQDQIFQASEGVVSTVNAGSNGTSVLSITVPAGALLGNTRMRVRGGNDSILTTAQACGASSSVYGETEDYIVTIVAPAACTAPLNQPTTLTLTLTGGLNLTGSFVRPNPLPDNYLVVLNTTGIPPTPLNGTLYTAGSTALGGTNVVIDTDNNTAFSTLNLNPLTTYYAYVFAYNNASCTAGPVYNTINPLNGTFTTTSCIPSVSSGRESQTYITTISFVGTLNDTTNSSTFSSSPRGYQDFSGLANIAKQAQGEGVNIEIDNKLRGFIKAWVDWNKNGNFEDAGELVYNSNDIKTQATVFGFVIPSSQPLGIYKIRIRLNDGDSSTPDNNELFNSCQNLNSYGEVEDYAFEVVPSCLSLITSVSSGENCGSGTVNLMVTGSAGVTQYKWYSALTGGTLLATTATGTWTTPVISANTTYYVTAINGCESLVRTPVTAIIRPVPVLAFTPTNPQVCGENAVIALTASGDYEETFLVNETFESGTLGVFNNINNDANNATYDVGSAWKNTTGTFVPAGPIWNPAIASAIGNNKFALTTNDFFPQAPNTIENSLVLTNPINTTNFINLNLAMKFYYSRYLADNSTAFEEYVVVEASTNNFATVTTVADYKIDLGIGTRFADLLLNLTPFINQTNLKIRIRFRSYSGGSGWLPGGAAVDDIKIYGIRTLSSSFNWSGTSLPDAYSDAATTIPYIAGTPATTVYVKPTLAQLEMGSYTFTASTTLTNGCVVSTPITITNTSKVWKGTTSTDWNTASNWLPVGVPDANTCVIIPANSIISGSGYDAYGKNLTIKNTGNLELQSGNNLTITDWVKNEGGVFKIKDTGSLVQINNVANTGNMNMERISQPMYQLDYTYWNSPVTAASGFTLGNLTTATAFIFDYNPTQSGGNGIWTPKSPASVMVPTKGYIARAPLSFPLSGVKQTQTVNFIGTPNNGDLFMPISKGTNANIGTSVGGAIITDADDEWNLIGNPYPSAIDITSFLSHPSNIPVVDGTVYLWTHNTPPSAAIPDPFYGNYVMNYTASDYATVNSLGATATAGSGGTMPTKYIGAGQSFFISAATGMTNGTTANVVFNNSMRVTNNNTNFFRNSTENNATGGFTSQRIWLNLSNNNGGFSQILVGYATGATLGWDRGLDGEALAGNAVKFYSLSEDKKLTIQGRPLPFVQEDQIMLGYKAITAGNYSIGIDHFDSEFIQQNIYLEDQLLHVIHDLKAAPYSFTSQQGTFESRFVLRYTQSTLGTSEITALENSVMVYTNDKLNVKSTSEPIKSIIVFDVLGRTLAKDSDVNSNEYVFGNLSPTEKTLLIKVELTSGGLVTKKVIF